VSRRPSRSDRTRPSPRLPPSPYNKHPLSARHQKGGPVTQLTGDRVPGHALAATPVAPVIRLNDAARHRRAIGREMLADHLQAEPFQTSERGQIRVGKGSVRHVGVFQIEGVRTSIIRRPRPLPPDRRATPTTPWIGKSRGSRGPHPSQVRPRTTTVAINRHGSRQHADRAEEPGERYLESNRWSTTSSSAPIALPQFTRSS
jgi:hypothetical protein